MRKFKEEKLNEKNQIIVFSFFIFCILFIDFYPFEFLLLSFRFLIV